MCGELNPSYVCSAHRGTPRDPWYWLKEQPSEEARQDAYDARQARLEDSERAA